MAIQDMLDGFDGKIAGLNDNISQLDQQIATVQAEQDSLQDSLDTIESEVSTFLSAKGDWVFTHSDYYTGSLDIDANVTDWQVFNNGATDITYVSSATFNVPGNQESTYTAGLILYFKSSSPSHPIPYGTVSSAIYNDIEEETLITMNMTIGVIPAAVVQLLTLVYEKDGTGWDSDSYLTTRFDEFLYINDYIHKPYSDLEGTYGTIATINALNTGRSTLVGSRDKYIEGQTKLVRFA